MRLATGNKSRGWQRHYTTRPTLGSMRSTAVSAVFVVTTLVLAISSSTTQAQDAPSLPQQQARPWERSHKSYNGHRKRSHHRVPDRSKPQRPFRGGRVRHPMFEGAGCPTNSVALVNASDTNSFALSALFSQFQAQTSDEKLRERRSCTITVVLEPEENMSIGVAHVDFRGSAYVPVGTSAIETNPAFDASDMKAASARLRASYTITGASNDYIANTTYPAGFDDQFYESFDVSETAWTPCEPHMRGGPRRRSNVHRVFEFRIHATITATKASASDEDVVIAVDTSDATLQKGVYYELTTRPCEASSGST